jgi:hypothetical protein
MKRIRACFLAMLLLAAPAVLAQFTYTTNNGAITITGYRGPGSVVTIPSATNGLPVTGIGDFAFTFYAVTSVAIPNSVTNIGAYAFYDCTSLEAITVDAHNPDYSSLNGLLFNKGQTALVLYPVGAGNASYTIPNSVSDIGANAFYGCSGLTNVIIPNTVINIEANAFDLCSGLTSITIPNSVTSLGDYAFDECTSLASAAIGSGVTSIGYSAFFGTSLTIVAIPANVMSIGDYAFGYCRSLTNVTIPAGVGSIGGYAFEYCTSLTGVYFQGNAPVADSTAFLFATGTVYYLPGTLGWGFNFAGLQTAPWALPFPLILSSSLSFGLPTNPFAFTISWATNAAVVVEACTNLVNARWQPLQTNTLAGGSAYFSDAQWTNYASRFYRISLP